MHPLEGIKVLDFSTMLNGPYATMLLSDMGADVIKVEPPDGDSWRAVGGGFIACNRGKRAICVDLKKEEAKQIILSLIEKSDVLVENARWGVWHRLGLDYESVIKKNRTLSMSPSWDMDPAVLYRKQRVTIPCSRPAVVKVSLKVVWGNLRFFMPYL